MKTFRETKRALQRGATLTGYALTLSAFAAAGLSTMAALEEQSGEFLTDTGNHIGEARPDQYELETTILAAPTQPPSTVPPTQPPSTEPPPTDPPVTDPPVTDPPATDPPLGPSGDLISEGVLKPVTDGLCLVVGGDNKVRQQPCDPNNPQQFQVHERPDGFVTLSIADGTCLGAGPAVDPVRNETCTEDPNQLWTYVPSYTYPDGTQTYNLLNEGNQRCLDVSGNSTSAGAELITWSNPLGSCKTSDSPNNHQFTISDPAAVPQPVLVQDASDADLNGSMWQNGGRVGTDVGSTGNFYNGADTSTGSATFTFTVTEGGDYTILAHDTQQNGGSADSFWVMVNGQPQPDGYRWHMGGGNGDKTVTHDQDTLVVNLPPGDHTVTFFVREDGSWLGGAELVKQ